MKKFKIRAYLVGIKLQIKYHLKRLNNSRVTTIKNVKFKKLYNYNIYLD